MICDNIGVNAAGRLTFAGQDVTLLAEKYGTPLYLMDEERIRNNCRLYKSAMKKHFGGDSMPLYASKAASFKRIYEIAKEEGMGIDVVSPGEIYTAVKSGFDMSLAYFHSNNKTDWDIAFAMESGVGYFVADNDEELSSISRIALEKGITQKVLLRLTPGIDTHTYDAVNTGKVDSKFGAAIETGQALELTEHALSLGGISLEGFHCHIGSQVFAEDVFQRGAVIMLRFMASLRDKFGYAAKILNLGGGYGVRYVDTDGYLDIDARMGEVALCIRDEVEALGMDMPAILMEPGRSIVADAGMTLYTAGSVKKIKGYKNYVAIDGGMTDNPRYALYGSKYTVLAASRMNEKADFLCDVVGRCCESGDIIQPEVYLPEPRRGDIIAVCTTGAYNYSMASNYNRIPRPAVVMLAEGESYVAVRRETLDDLISCDL